MSIAYNVRGIRNPKDRTKTLFHLQAKSYGRVTREWLIEDMVRHTSLTEQEAITAIDYMFESIPRYLRLGMTVQIGKLGYFKYTIKSTGVNETDEALPDKVKSIHLRFVPGRGVREMVRNFDVSEWEEHF